VKKVNEIPQWLAPLDALDFCRCHRGVFRFARKQLKRELFRLMDEVIGGGEQWPLAAQKSPRNQKISHEKSTAT
jgi:hypothetical protein